MIEIFYDGWGNSSTNTFDTLRMLSPDPEHSLARVQNRGDYLKCIAIQDYHRNAYTVYSPFNSVFKFDRSINQIHVDGDNIVNSGKFYPDGTVELQLYPQYVFRSSQSVIMQMLPPLLTPPLKDVFVAPGEFDIGQWMRPLNTCFIVPAGVEQFEVCEGDPLFSVRFITQNQQPVKITRKALDSTEVQLVNACANLTYVKSGTKLSWLYQRFNRFRQAIKPSKCPFHRS